MIEKQDNLFYRLTVCGVWDPKQGKLGDVATVMLETGTAIVDTATNTLAAPYHPDPARDLTLEEAKAFLGEKAGDLLKQVQASEARIAALQADRLTLRDAFAQLAAAAGQALQQIDGQG